MRQALRCLVLAALAAALLSPLPSTATTEPETRLAVLQAGPAPLRTPFPVSHVGVRWRGSEEALVEVRTGQPGRLGPWQGMHVAHDLGDEQRQVRLSGLIRAPRATAVEARSRGDVADLEVVVIDAVTGYPLPAPTVATAAPGWTGPDQPPVISRGGWGADESKRKAPPEFAPISKLVVHHTVTPNDDPDPASTVRAIYAYHTQSNGWNDIGYNFLVDASGRIYEGRWARDLAPGETPTGEDDGQRGVIGAHARGFNTGSVGVAVLGDFSGGVGPSPAAIDSLVNLLAWKAGRHGIDAKRADTYTAADGSSHVTPNLAGHRDLGQTACPGGRLYDRLPEIRERVAAAAQRVPAPPAPAPEVPAPLPPVPAPPGFWTATADGRVRAFGDAPSAGDLAGKPLGGPIASLSATTSGQGYWLAGADGGVFAFGDAGFFGSAVGRVRSPVVQLEPTPSGAGYWVVSAGGEVVGFGDAAFLGGTSPLPVTVTGMASTPTGRGYWLAAGDGRVFPFGDALTGVAPSPQMVAGVAGGAPAGVSIVAIAAHPSGRGYWLLGSDGGVFAFDAPFHGSVPSRHARTAAVQIRPTPGGGGYYVAGHDGAVFAFGDADPRRERPSRPEEEGVIDLALHRAGS